MAGSLFGKQVAQEAPFPQADSSSLERRIRAMEEGLTNLRKIVQVTEENILVKNRHISTEFKTIVSDINDLRRELQDVKDKMLLVLKEMQGLARQEDVKVIERYVNMWNPVRFVTQGEVEELVQGIVDKQLELSDAKKLEEKGTEEDP